MRLTSRLCAVALAWAMLCFVLIMPAIAQVAESPRQTVDLSTGWRFRFGDAPDAVTAAGFDDSGWEQVSVPHTWNRIGEYALTRGPATNNKQGVGWYRLNFNAPAAAKGRRQYLDFAAVAIIADAWVNGVHVGQHQGGYSRFRFDVTAAWKPGAANLIVVKADNSKPAVGSTTEHVLPLAGDFFQHGGIYRGVSLITANDVGIDLLDMGGPGVYVRTEHSTTPPMTKGTMDLMRAGELPEGWGQGDFELIFVRGKYRSFGSFGRKASPLITIRDAEGKQIDMLQGFPLGSRRERHARSNTDREFEYILFLHEPHRWFGRTGPYLYTVTVELKDGSKLLDSVTVPFGIRTVKFDPNTGATLNGTPLKLHGVSRHQDRLGKGYALSAADHAEDMAIMQEMGVNAVRMAHYQHADEWADEADRAGMLVWAEVPYVTTPSLSGGEGSAEVFANAEQQLRELIRQNYNHPSIVMWSIGNEVDAATLFGASKEPVKPLKLLQHLQRVAKEEDPSRPTTFADCCEDVRVPMAGVDGSELAGDSSKVLAGAADMIGYNRYYGWYYPQPLKAAEQLGSQMDKFHAKHPTLPISISEYGAGGAISQHSDNPTTGFVNAIGRPQPEEYESWLHEQSWPVIRDRPFIYGSFVWNMFDFASDLRNEGDAVDINTKGLVTMDRKTRKDAFYYYQAQWTDWKTAAMVHINSARYTDRAYPVTDVRVYSNAPHVELSVNGTGLGSKACTDKICVWPGVALKPGSNRVTASVSIGSKLIADAVTWNGPDPAQGIRIDAGDNAGRTLGTRRFGSDNFVSGGTPAVLNQGGFGGRRSGPLKVVTAPDPALYDYWREGDAFSYAIPLPNGKWTVTIHSFEPRNAGSPMMAVSANGKLVIPAFGVRNAAGGSLKGLARAFPVTVKRGVLTLDFSATGGKAVVAAIEVLPEGDRRHF
jgi:beta-galactosidase